MAVRIIPNISEVPIDLRDPISRDVFIHPVKTDCNSSFLDWIRGDSHKHGHVFELSSLFQCMKQKNICPLCRATITEVVPDLEMARRVQDEFVRLNPQNQAYFEQLKHDTYENPRSNTELFGPPYYERFNLDTAVEKLNDHLNWEKPPFIIRICKNIESLAVPVFKYFQSLTYRFIRFLKNLHFSNSRH